MEDVTDTVFREIIASGATTGKLHVLFTEFMSVDGFLHEIGNAKSAHRLVVSDQERAILDSKGIKLVAQIWGSDPEKFHKTALRLSEQKAFDGIDINMGCPVKKIVKKNACSALINVPDLAKEIVIATREGTQLPVSVKTRIGFNAAITEKWIGNLLEVTPAAITIHGRTQKMLSNGEADWSEVYRAVQLRNLLNSKTVILGNGDIASYTDGLNRSATYQTDGIMVGRGIFRNPGFFANTEALNQDQSIQLLKKHLVLFSREWEGRKSYAILKRFFKIYIRSFENATELRIKLMKSNNFQEGLEVVGEYEAINKHSTSNLVSS